MSDADEFSFLVNAPETPAPPASAAEHLGFMGTAQTAINLPPRTAHGWQRLLAKLKVEKQSAYKNWLYRRDHSPCSESTASTKEIEQAMADVKALEIEIEIARARLDAWLWCPWEAVPSLNCHIVNPAPTQNLPRRLWTISLKRAYRTEEIRELTEKLEFARMISKRPDLTTVKPWVPDQDVVDAKATFDRLSEEMGAAEKGFTKFKLKGPPPETEAEEIARRMAGVDAAAGCAGGAGCEDAGGVAAAGGDGAAGARGTRQGHQPPPSPVAPS